MSVELYESRTQSWRARWIYTEFDDWKMLHRLSTFDHPSDDWFDGEYTGAGGTGATVCGLTGEVQMPGILSRMGLARCPKCCEIVGVPNGNGAPFNDKTIPEDHPERVWIEPQPLDDADPPRASAREESGTKTDPDKPASTTSSKPREASPEGTG